jgi:hypothetical protein
MYTINTSDYKIILLDIWVRVRVQSQSIERSEVCHYVLMLLRLYRGYIRNYVSRHLQRGIVMEQCANVFMCVNEYLPQQFPIRNPLITAVASFLENFYD